MFPPCSHLPLTPLPHARSHRGVDQPAGNKLMPGAQPHAHAYCGHQFGSFAGQLGDGAAMYLGEVEGSSGRCVRGC